MIAVTFAHRSESRDFVRQLTNHEREVKVLHTGIGGAAARASLEPFLESQPFELVISSGFAGATDPSLGVGDLLLADNFSDPRLLARARDLIIARVATLATAEQIIESAADRARFAREEGAAAVDMETEWIAQACAARQVPLLSLRAISDTPAALLPAPPEVLFDLDRQKTDGVKLAGYLLRHPLAVVRLARFAQRIAAPRASLTSALSVLLREL